MKVVLLIQSDESVLRLQQGAFVFNSRVSLCRAAPARGGAVPGCPPPQRGLHQLLPAVCRGPPHLQTLQTGRYALLKRLYKAFK